VTTIKYPQDESKAYFGKDDFMYKQMRTELPLKVCHIYQTHIVRNGECLPLQIKVLDELTYLGLTPEDLADVLQISVRLFWQLADGTKTMNELDWYRLLTWMEN
jgi:hypothetical protein